MDMVEKFEQVCDKARGFLCTPLVLMWSIPLIMAWRLLGSSPADPDLFARVAMGRLALSNNYVPLKDPFAFTQTLPMWVDHEWLSGVIFYVIASTLGDAGLIGLKIILATVTAVCVILASQRYAPQFTGRFVWITLCLLHAAAAWTSTVRCQAFTYLFVPMLYWAIIEYRKDRNIHALAFSPLLAVAWINMHGGYALGCVLIAILCGVELVERRLSRALLLIALGWALAPIFTPYGWRGFATFLIHSLGMERPGIIEWFPLHTDLPSFALTVLFCLPLIGGILFRKGVRDLFGLAAIAFSGYCAFRHIRFLPFFMITAAIFGSPYVDAAIERAKSLRPHLYTAAIRCGSLVLTGFLGLGALHLLVMALSPSTYRMDYKNFPIGAIEWLRSRQTQGRLLVDFNTGSYALWRLYPNMKISVDGRYEECYPKETVQDNALAFSPGLEVGRAALERFDPTHILLPLNHGVTNPDAAFGDTWKVVYRDPQALVLRQGGDDTVETRSNTETAPRDIWEPLF